MQPLPLDILLVEDNPADARLIKEELSDFNKYSLETVGRLDLAVEYLQNHHTDLVLLDLSLPDAQGMESVTTISTNGLNVPLIILTGLDDEKTAIQALQSGAQDYLVKGSFEGSLLEQRILFALERKKKEEAQSKQRLEIVQQVVVSARQDIQKSDLRNIFFRCVEDCNEAMMIMDNVGIVVYVNPAWQKIYGYSVEEVLGKNLYGLQRDDASKKSFKQIWEAVTDSNRNFWRGEVSNVTKDGRSITVLLTIAPSRSPSGQIVGYMGIALNMTAQKELETKMFQQERLVSLGILGSGLAHEIGTPLGIIRGNAEFLKEDVFDRPNVTEGLDVIITQIDRISKLVESLLKLSRGSRALELAAFRLSDLVNEVIPLLEGSFKKRSLQLTIDVPSSITVLADSHRMQQIMINILVNSIHAIDEALAKGKAGPHKVSIRGYRDGESVHLAISDSGCGIPIEIRKKLFQPFFTTKDVGKGTGLGLAIVYNLVHEMGGEIEVESVVDSFTTFDIQLKGSGPAIKS